MDGKVLSPSDVSKLADLESRECCWPSWPAR